MSDALAGWGIPVALGFDPQNVLADRPDLVVIGNAVRADNPEAQVVFDAGIPYLSFPTRSTGSRWRRHSVVVAGTHGKTTTTALLGSLLVRAGRDPSVLVGGSRSTSTAVREGKGPHFVVEGDEYDTAFFDKTPKFWHYHPRTLLLTSVEFDHADIYRDLDHIKDVFRTLVREMPADGTIVAALDDADVCDVLDGARCKVIGYGVDDGEHGFRALDLEAGPQGTRFRIVRDEHDVATAVVPMYGRHNVANALGAIAVAVALGVPAQEAADALAGFRGVRRRQEVRGTERGVTVLDDFAHHPTAVRETVAAMHMRYPAAASSRCSSRARTRAVARSSSRTSSTHCSMPTGSSSRSSRTSRSTARRVKSPSTSTRSASRPRCAKRIATPSHSRAPTRSSITSPRPPGAATSCSS